MHKCSWPSIEACEKCSEKSSSSFTNSQKANGLNSKSCSILRFKEKEGKGEWISVNLQSICSVSNFLWDLSRIYSIISLPLWVQPFIPLKHHCSLTLLAFSDEEPTYWAEVFSQRKEFPIERCFGFKEKWKALNLSTQKYFQKYTNRDSPGNQSVITQMSWWCLGPSKKSTDNPKPMPVLPVTICEVKFMRIEAGLSIFFNIFLQSCYTVLAHNFHFQIHFFLWEVNNKTWRFLHIWCVEEAEIWYFLNKVETKDFDVYKTLY